MSENPKDKTKLILKRVRTICTTAIVSKNMDMVKECNILFGMYKKGVELSKDLLPGKGEGMSDDDIFTTGLAMSRGVDKDKRQLIENNIITQWVRLLTELKGKILPLYRKRDTALVVTGKGKSRRGGKNKKYKVGTRRKVGTRATAARRKVGTRRKIGIRRKVGTRRNKP